MNTQQKLKKYLGKIKKEDKKINSFIHIRNEKELLDEARAIDEKIHSKKSGKLAGMIVAVKSNINVKGLKISCASKTLENYQGTYDADVIDKIKKEDGLIIGMTNMDEFACGSSGETSYFGVTRNPNNPDLIPGGSSSGSAAAVAAGFCDVALGSETGGSIRNPSSHCGIVGVKPSYGLVSRHGLIDLSMSLDQIGPMARNVKDAALLLDVIKGKSENDSTSFSSKEINVNKIGKAPKKISVGILNFDSGNKELGELIKSKVSECVKRHGWNSKEVEINYLDLAVQTYYPLVYVEFFSGTRRFDGRKYGFKIEDVSGVEVLRRILGGSEISKAEYGDRYYHKALKVKKLIETEFENVFKKFDCVISPTVVKEPHKIGSSISVEEMYNYDILTTPSNLAGNCAMSIPAGRINGFPVGMQIICDKFQEEKMLQIANAIEKLNSDQ